ncbi:head-tail joining protein [Rhodobacter capsulatus]|uniref:head-tail joining protein n=1 Tax=Rhodobacter capsulatus TaxID=1061 RepID=UPI00402742CB
MTVFAAAIDRLFEHPALAASALWISATSAEERQIRVIARAPDRVTDFGAGRFVSDTTVVDVRVADLPAPRPGDLIVIGAERFVIQGEPLRDRERLIWTLDLRPEGAR